MGKDSLRFTTLEELGIRGGGNPRNKYGAQLYHVDGVTLQSKAEAVRYRDLRLLERAGEIKDLRVHPAFAVLPWFTHTPSGRKVKGVSYVADFSYVEIKTGQTIVEDVKGVLTYSSDIKIKMFLHTIRDDPRVTFKLRSVDRDRSSETWGPINK